MSNSIKKVAFSVYPVKDMAKSRAFYEETLGLKAGDDFGGGWQEYDIGGTTFAISSAVAESLKPGTQGSVAFEVSNLDALVETLRAKKVEFIGEKPMDTPVCRIAFIRDPDGNHISLHQLK